VRRRRDTGSAAARLGAIGLPEPIVELRRRRWDAIVVGGGHNGLACAAYLARAKQNVLVLEARERIGEPARWRRPGPGSGLPCAYLAGLLHPLVIEELGMEARGFQWMHAGAGLFVPFEDGSSIQLWDDAERCEAEIRRFAPRDLDGFRALRALKERVRDAIRPSGSRDLWIGRAPTRGEIEERLAGDEEGRRLLFQWSMIELVERYLRDERLQMALLGQGVIGTNASPHAPVRLRSTSTISPAGCTGRPAPGASSAGHGHGVVHPLRHRPRARCDRCDGRPRPADPAGEGVELEAGECIPAPIVVSNADRGPR
jgi:phytoene dehydrogenase-like protein